MRLKAWDWDAIGAEVEPQLAGLDGIALDRQVVEDLAARVADGRVSRASNVVENPVPAGSEDVATLEELERRAELAELGRHAIERGEVAVAVLNGGMATRFGGIVKGIVEVSEGRSFLEIKLAQSRAACAASGRSPVPFLAMNSFATHRPTLDFLDGKADWAVRSFLQSVSLRLTPDGSPFRDAQGRVSLYAPGHGDFPSALRDSGLLAQLEAEGVRAVMLSNVDNLGAELDPVVVGYHLAGEQAITCEVARTVPGDVGGSPARVQGLLQIVEGFRFAPDFDFSRLEYLATNSFLFSLEALREAHPSSWFYVEKSVDGRPAVQIERLVNELCRQWPTRYLAVPRDGPRGRFIPIKTRDDLEALRRDAELSARFAPPV